MCVGDKMQFIVCRVRIDSWGQTRVVGDVVAPPHGDRRNRVVWGVGSGGECKVMGTDEVGQGSGRGVLDECCAVERIRWCVEESGFVF